MGGRALFIEVTAAWRLISSDLPKLYLLFTAEHFHADEKITHSDPLLNGFWCLKD